MRFPASLTLAVTLATGACVIGTDEDLWKHNGDAATERTATPDVKIDHDTAGIDLRSDQAQDDAELLPDGPAVDLAIDSTSDVLLPDIGPRPLGEPCAVDSHCLSGHCVDDVCCATACTAVCSSCAVIGSEGTCTAAPAGTDPHEDCVQDPVSTCGLDGTCDGAGGCRTYPENTACIPDHCVGETRIAGSVCNASGACAAKPEVECAPYRCDPSTKSCFTTCTADAQCYRYRCNTNTNACFTSCSTPAQCQKGYACQSNVCQ
jgi:hypothetical protein